MNAPTNTAPLAHLSAAETALVRQVHAAADRLDAVGTADLDAALARLRESAERAKARLLAAARAVNAVAAEVLYFLDDVAAGIGEDLLADASIYPPSRLEPTTAPAALPEPEPAASTPATATTLAEATVEPSGQNDARAMSHSVEDDVCDLAGPLPAPEVVAIAACQPIDSDETVDLGAPLPPPPDEPATDVLPERPPATPAKKPRSKRRR
jgi:hypothetical protein